MAWNWESLNKKGLRHIRLYDRLCMGKSINKTEVAMLCGLSEKTVQRDIEDLREYLLKVHGIPKKDSIVYDRTEHCYRMRAMPGQRLDCREVAAVSKILLESRALGKTEICNLLGKLKSQCSPEDRRRLDLLLANDLEHYQEMGHHSPLIERVWQAVNFIQQEKKMHFQYTRQDGKSSSWIVSPVALIFSDFYFYLMGYIDGKEREYPTAFRLDRCHKIANTGKRFSIVLQNFPSGEYRNRIQFMYPGPPVKLKFLFWGGSLEAVQDRLPTAVARSAPGGKYLVEAEVFGGIGVKMWLLSQMEFLEVLEPLSLREEMAATASRLVQIYQ